MQLDKWWVQESKQPLRCFVLFFKEYFCLLHFIIIILSHYLTWLLRLTLSADKMSALVVGLTLFISVTVCEQDNNDKQKHQLHSSSVTLI